MEKLAQDTRIQDAATPALLHPDVNERNIYVSTEEPSIITGLLDWRSASIEPTFIYANETPDFVGLPEEPEENPFEKTNSRNKGEKMHRSATRHTMSRWTELGLQGSYPYSPTEEELKEYVRDYDDFEPLQRLKTMA
ncbi:hypothetical protein ETB97_011932 [Aspergillus alliaceus]|uniref:Aminoglycoside phosphotransferase domain-containing protein n=1 Tax=Petromyces alliaceus TaxID=209559 RepID=A0A8H6A7P8_PETAA|nr:hypothetical protein ETB97_011932 [Aspergillus burnettii]